jgi:hypothetical protein
MRQDEMWLCLSFLFDIASEGWGYASVRSNFIFKVHIVRKHLIASNKDIHFRV